MTITDSLHIGDKDLGNGQTGHLSICIDPNEQIFSKNKLKYFSQDFAPNKNTLKKKYFCMFVNVDLSRKNLLKAYFVILENGD